MKRMQKYNVFLLIFVLILQFFMLYDCNNCKKCKAVSITNLEYTSKAEAMATIEATTGKLLYSKDENKKLPMASTTKILTAIIAIENCKDLNQKHEIKKEMTGIEGSSIYLKSGEHLSVRELLYGLMLRSGNDSAVAIAIIVGGSVENFLKLMNQKCLDLGLADTHIETVNGLHSEGHYTTALELAKITAYALKNKIFAEIVATKFAKIDNELGNKDKIRYLKNKNKLLNMIEGADGVKTGYTTKSGRCFVGSATRNGIQIISVVLNCSNWFEESAYYIEKAFQEYTNIDAFKAGIIIQKEIYVDNKKTQIIPILLKNDIRITINKENISKIYAKLEVKNNIQTPHIETDSIGELRVYVENDLIFSEKVYTINIDKDSNIGDYVKKIIDAF